MTCFSTSSFALEVLSPRELRTEFRPPFVFTHSLSLFLSTATVPSCHPTRLFLPSILLSTRIITKLFYQIFHIHLGQLHIFLGLVLQVLCSFRSVEPLFFVFFNSLTFYSQKTTRAENRLTISASIPIVQVSYVFFPDIILTLTLKRQPFIYSRFLFPLLQVLVSIPLFRSQVLFMGSER